MKVVKDVPAVSMSNLERLVGPEWMVELRKITAGMSSAKSDVRRLR